MALTLLWLLLATPAAEPLASDSLAPPESAVGPAESEPDSAPYGEWAEDFRGPTPIGEASIPFPADAPPLSAPVRVAVKLRVGPDGAVEEVTLLESAGPPFDEAVLVGATHFRFEPARYRGQPVAVEITFAQTFEPPPTAPVLPVAGLRGTVVEMGTRRPVANALVLVRSGETELRAEANEEGVFAVRATPGSAEVEVRAAGYKRFLVHEELVEGEELEVRYLAERLSYDPYETLVVTRRERTEVARTSLRDRELKQVPGTFGDPFRVVTALPGVGQMMSLLAYPVVRGTSPGSTGFLLNGVPIPQLFHLLGGPAVIHPEFIDRVDFYPGTFPARYGGYTGGIVDGVSRRPRQDESRLDLNVDLVRAGAFVERPLGDLANVTVAGTYGYPGALLSLLQTGAFLSYWDYQLRLEAGQHNRFSTFVFGSFDEFGTEQEGERVTQARSQFHRVDMRYQRGEGDAFETAEVTFGLDQVLSGEETEGSRGATLRTLSVAPRLGLERKLGSMTRLRTGAEWALRVFRGTPQTMPTGQQLTMDSRMYSAGAFVELPTTVTPRLIVTPGARTDVYTNSRATKWAFDPRLAFRWQAFAAGDTWLKGGVGYYHQPPRFFIPVPGFEDFALSRGLLGTIQTSLGVEQPLSEDFLADVQAYYHHMDPILFDLALNTKEFVPVDDEGNPEGPVETPFLERRVGRSYGLEVLMRKRDSGRLFGWISYTLSKSERRFEGQWVPFDFDRRHMLNVVAGIKLERNWEVGGRLQFQTGRPVTTAEYGYNGERVAPFHRFDLRIDKRAVWNEFLLDFYVEVLNVSLAAEELEATLPGVPFILPFVGFRAVL